MGCTRVAGLDPNIKNGGVGCHVCSLSTQVCIVCMHLVVIARAVTRLRESRRVPEQLNGCKGCVLGLSGA